MSDTASFGMWLRQRRRSFHLTQAELARQVGCAEETVQKIETGAVRPSKQLAARFTRILGAADDEAADLVALARGNSATPAVERAPAPSPTRYHHLPAQLTSLIGRGEEVDRVRTLLLHPEVRLVTLTGPGGIGKTRVAIESATQLLDAFPDGVVFVDLSTLVDSRLVLLTIADRVGFSGKAGDSLFAALVEALRGQSFLVVLDNFEQVVDAAATMVQLLASCPGIKLLVTSRIVLGAPGEHEIVMPPLALPARSHVLPLEQFAQYEAVHLFVERAQAANPRFALTPAHAPAIAELCHRLDRLPLAIELMAAWTKLFEPPALLTRFDRLLQQASSDYGRPSRQQTVWHSIDWSYLLLSPSDQTLFRQIGVFAGGATLAAIESVAGGAPGASLDGVFTLIGHSLLRRLGWSPDDADGNPRVGMLETIREYALWRLKASPDSQAVRRRHAYYFTALAEAGQAQLVGPRQGELLRKLEADYDNIRVALDWSLRDGDAGLGLRLAGALAEFWELRGHASEGRRWLDTLLATASTPSLARLNALHAAIVLAVNQADVGRATELAEQYVATAHALGDQRRIAQAVAELAQVAKLRVDLEQAKALFAEALALFRAQGAQHEVASMLLNLGVITGLDQGDAAQAAPFLDECLALYQQLKYPKGMTYALVCESGIAITAGDFERAARASKAALRLAWPSEFLLMVAFSFTTSAAVVVMQQQPERAVRLFSAAEAIFAELQYTLDPPQQIRHDHWLGAARDALDEAAFAVAWAEGLALPREQLVAELLA